MMPRRRARLNLMHFCYLHLIVLGASIECKSVTTNTCCEIINVFSAGALAQFHPEHLGSYKLLKGEDHVYKAVTETQSFLFLFRSGVTSDKWVIGKDFKSQSFVATWPLQASMKSRIPFSRQNSLFKWLFGGDEEQVSKRRNAQEDVCPLSTRGNFQVWDGYKFNLDETVRVECMVEKIDSMNPIGGGCCETVRLASAHSSSISMKWQRHKMGIFHAIGHQNGRLVYKQSNPKEESNYAYSWQDRQGLIRWMIGKNYTTNDRHGIESVQALNENDCLTDVDTFNVYSRRNPKHLFDETQGWFNDPSLRVECYDTKQVCCPTVEVRSESYGATFYPHAMGTYIISNDYQVSGRRVYRHQSTDAEFLIYLHDWGPKAGMEWTFSTRLGDPSFKSITSANVENAFPLNLCLTDASHLTAGLNVWDGRKWRLDPTLSITCTFVY